MFRRSFAVLLAVALISPVVFAADDPPVIADAKKALKDPAKPFAMWVSVTAKKGQEKALEAAFAECRKGTRQEKGNAAYDLLADAETPGKYAFYERWTGIDGLRSHMKEPHTTKLLAKFGDLLEPGTTIKFHTVVGD